MHQFQETRRRARPQAKFLELVHRLDRDTSGVLLLAKKRSALTALQEQFRQRETGKTYAALERRRCINACCVRQPRRTATIAPGLPG